MKNLLLLLSYVTLNFFYIHQFQNVGSGLFIKLYLFITFYIILKGCIDGSTMSFKCSGLVCRPDSCQKLHVVEEVDSGLVVDQEHASEI